VENKKTVIFINEHFFFGIIVSPAHFDAEKVKALVKEDESPEIVDKKWTVKKGLWGKGVHESVQIISYAGNFKEKKILEHFTNLKFTLLK